MQNFSVITVVVGLTNSMITIACFGVHVMSHDMPCPQVPDLCEDLLAAVDQPLKVSKCKETGRDYLLCDYNRDGDSYR